MQYTDRMLTCEQCGSQFVFTVTEQREMAERGAELYEPKFCPSCRAAEEPGVKLIGRVKWFDAGKGWGFITKADGKDIFVHRSGIEGRSLLRDGQEVEFRIEQTPKGPAAVEVVPLDEIQNPKDKVQNTNSNLSFGL